MVITNIYIKSNERCFSRIPVDYRNNQYYTNTVIYDVPYLEQIFLRKNHSHWFWRVHFTIDLFDIINVSMVHLVFTNKNSYKGKKTDAAQANEKVV